MVTLVSEEEFVDVEYDWRQSASCLNVALNNPPGENPFFKEGRGPNYPIAREFCAGCPVVIDCLLEGLHEDNVGFWGCMSSNERAQVRRRLRHDVDFFEAVEEVWSYHRGHGKPVPPTRVWREWKI